MKTIKADKESTRNFVSYEINRDFDMSPEAVSYRNRNSDGNPKRPLRSLLRIISQCIDTMREVHNGNENFKYYEFEQAEHQAKRAIEKLDELL